MPSISSLVSIQTGSNSRRPSRVRLRIADISRSILPIDDLMKPSASEKSSESCLSAPSSTGSAVSVAFSGADGAADCSRDKRCDPLEDVAAQFLQLAGEAHDVHQRRAQIVADDVGEALDLVIGFAQVGGALVDRGLEVEIIVAQPGFGLVARARRAPHQEDRDAGQRDHEARADAGDRGRQRLAAIGVGRALDKQPVFLGPHPHREIVDMFHGVAPDALAHDLGGVVHALLDRAVRCRARIPRSAVVERHAVSLMMLDLNRIVADRAAPASSAPGMMFGDGFSKSVRNSGRNVSEIAALRAFGAAHLQQESDIWFSTSTVCTTARAVLARLVDQRTEAALIAISTRNPAASSRICPMARLRWASAVTVISRHEQTEQAPLANPYTLQRAMEPIGSMRRRIFQEVFAQVLPSTGWPARYCSSQWMW